MKRSLPLPSALDRPPAEGSGWSSASSAGSYSTSSTNTTYGSSPNSASITGSSSSSLDCFNSIGVSLKRVKISTSPGELRLNKDLESMASSTEGGGRWVDIDDGPGNGIGNSYSASSQGAAHYHRALRSPDGSIIVRRDAVDPLRLRISVTFRTDAIMWRMVGWGIMAPSERQRPTHETWIYLVQIPRMYPHTAPLIYRITREGAGGAATERMGSMADQYQRRQQQQRLRQQSSEHTAEAGAHNNRRDQFVDRPPMVERVLISSSPTIHPPSATEGEMTGICMNPISGHDPTVSDAVDSTVAVYGGWSPISRLSDLVQFLAELPVRRLEAWAARRQQRLQGGGGEIGAAATAQHEQQQQQQEHTHDGERRGVVRRHQSVAPYDYSDYDNSGASSSAAHQQNGTNHLDRQRRRISQTSDEVDVARIHIGGGGGSGDDGTDADSTMDMSTSAQHPNHPQDRPIGPMDGGQGTSSSPLIGANGGQIPNRTPVKLEETFQPNRFDQGFDRGPSAARQLGRSVSAPDVANSAQSSLSSSSPPFAWGEIPTQGGHWRQPSADAAGGENAPSLWAEAKARAASRAGQQALLPRPGVLGQWNAPASQQVQAAAHETAHGGGGGSANPLGSFDRTAFRQSHVESQMMMD